MTPLVKEIIHTYQNQGWLAVREGHWNVWDWAHPFSTEISQWCHDHDAMDLLREIKSYAEHTADFRNKTYLCLKNNDLDGLEQLMRQRPDAVGAVVFSDRCGDLQWVNWVCERLGSSWDMCFERVFVQATMSGYGDTTKVALGGWCAQCRSLTCCTHPIQPFLNTERTDLLAGALRAQVAKMIYRNGLLDGYTSNLIDAVRNHAAWDNTHADMQRAAAMLLNISAGGRDTVALKKLLGPNDHWSVEQNTQRVCVNAEDIVEVLIQHWGMNQWNLALGDALSNTWMYLTQGNRRD